MTAYFARFRYCIPGRLLRGSLDPPHAVLFRKSKGHYLQDGHAHRLVFEGPSRFLSGYIWHDDPKPLKRWFESQQSYAALEARKLVENAHEAKSTADRPRQWIWPARRLSSKPC